LKLHCGKRRSCFCKVNQINWLRNRKFYGCRFKIINPSGHLPVFHPINIYAKNNAFGHLSPHIMDQKFCESLAAALEAGGKAGCPVTESGLKATMILIHEDFSVL
jgi:hypothetical protein